MDDPTFGPEDHLVELLEEVAAALEDLAGGELNRTVSIRMWAVEQAIAFGDQSQSLIASAKQLEAYVLSDDDKPEPEGRVQ